MKARSILRWAGPVVAAAVLAGVTWRMGSGPFLDGVRALDGGALAAVAAVFLLTTICFAWRWQTVANRLGLRLTLAEAVAAYYRSQFLNLTLPGGVAGDVHRGVRHGREVRNLGPALRAVVWERTAGQLVQVLITVSVLLLMPSPLRSSMPVVALALAAAAVVGVLIRKRTGRGKSLVLLDKRALPKVLFASTVAVLGHVLTFLIAARAVGVTAPVAQLVPLAFISIMAMALPNVGGWGPREGVTAWAFSAAGLGAGLGAATAVAYGVMVLAASLPGGLVLLGERLPRRRSALLRDQGELAHAPGPQPLAPEPVGTQQLLQRLLSDLRSNVGRIGGERFGQRFSHGGVRRGPVLLPADGQPDLLQASEHLLDRGQPHGVGVGHPLPLRLGEGQALLDGAGEPAAGRERAGDLLQQRLLLGKRQDRLEQDHHVERATGDRRDPAYLEATGEVAGKPASDLDGVGAVVDAEVVAAELAGDEAPGAADAAAQVQHRDARGDARLTRQGPNFTGAHEALLFDELAGRVRADSRPLEGTHKGGALILLHAEDASPAGDASLPGSIGPQLES
ncbi:MAG TPA: lysylphosphatidylglycerol synthase transmembrane domain-containing protein [Solirubrobacterales bacterium]|nr:lysylphosphatidylglycerol synthase transmembrane domain-containing protein [Solirubrobacterales bacterium]